MKDLLLKNWHFMRYLRFALAIFLGYQAFETKEWFFLGFAAFFLVQAVFNFGCGPKGCELPKKQNQ